MKRLESLGDVQEHGILMSSVIMSRLLVWQQGAMEISCCDIPVSGVMRTLKDEVLDISEY
jgi:hypothetical protein